ncbi:CHS-like protein [Mya arenaria]|uniref:chitin synthase n=2 Tax=Mya arenaria TaxID=6604 RepID=A0ABY7EH65_MYAAR|nr:CHS-like protein [Mya arenaria]
MYRNNLILKEDQIPNLYTLKNIFTFSDPGEARYILTTDADVDFTPGSIDSLLDMMNRDENVGAVCARTHPLGSGPIVWYQIFEYAIGHWLQKTAEHVIGTVLCAPGCFSLYRCSALAEVLPTYSGKVENAFGFLTMDMGEDRWLCTLMFSLSGIWRTRTERERDEFVDVESQPEHAEHLGGTIETNENQTSDPDSPPNPESLPKLETEEAEFWVKIQDRIKPEENRDTDNMLKGKLVDLRNTWLLLFSISNTLWMILIFTMASNAQLLKVVGSNPLGLVVLTIFLIVLTLQFLAMLRHRLSTFVHYIARRNRALGDSTTQNDKTPDNSTQKHSKACKMPYNLRRCCDFIKRKPKIQSNSPIKNNTTPGNSTIQDRVFLIGNEVEQGKVPPEKRSGTIHKEQETQIGPRMIPPGELEKERVRDEFVDVESQPEHAEHLGGTIETNENQTSDPDSPPNLESLQKQETEEAEFWVKIQDRIKPEENRDTDNMLKGKLVDLRNTWLLLFGISNTLWMILIFTMANNAELLKVVGSNPIGLVVLTIFLIVLTLQFLAMLGHRLGTFVHYIARKNKFLDGSTTEAGEQEAHSKRRKCCFSCLCCNSTEEKDEIQDDSSKKNDETPDNSTGEFRNVSGQLPNSKPV